MPSRVVADWVLPITAAPIRNGWVTVADGRITAVGGEDGSHGPRAGHRGRRAILPALVNAHTHLELSHLHGRIPPTPGFTVWVRQLLALRRSPPEASVVRDAATAAIAEARRCGTGLFGDVSNTLVTPSLLQEAEVSAAVFHELLGFNVADPKARVAEARARVDETKGGLVGESSDVRISLAPHAPYSVSPGLFDAIHDDVRAHGERSTVHLAESPEEVQLLADGSGPWRQTLEALQVWTNDWTPPGVSPVRYLIERGVLDASMLPVHLVQCRAEDVARLAAAGITIVSCPRSNAYVGVGAPPLAAFYAAGVPVALGTDSLASVEDLNVFGELAAARRIAPGVSARRLLESSTIVGARALGFDSMYGSLDPGKRAAVISVRIPDGVSDVEEYLVSGIQPADVSWVAGGPEAAPAS